MSYIGNVPDVVLHICMNYLETVSTVHNRRFGLTTSWNQSSFSIARHFRGHPGGIVAAGRPESGNPYLTVPSAREPVAAVALGRWPDPVSD